MADVAKCLVCGVHDVATIAFLSSSGATDTVLHLCVGHEKTFNIAVMSIVLRMRQDFRTFAEAIDGAALLDAELDGGLTEPKEEPRG